MSYKETAGCFCLLWPVALLYHPSGSNPREHKTKADPIGYAATSFYQVRMRSHQQQNWVSSCYSPCPHKNLECPVWLVCWLISAVPPAFRRRSFQLHRRRDTEASAVHYGPEAYPEAPDPSHLASDVAGGISGWKSTEATSKAAFSTQALQVLPTTAGKHHLAHAYTSLIHGNRLFPSRYH